MFCTDIPEPFLLIFSKTVPQLLYFSHIPTALVALLLGFFIFMKTRNGKNELVGQLLLFVAVLFSIWSILDIVLWTNVSSDKVAFVWSIINLVGLLVSSCTLYFSYVFLEKKDVPLFLNILLGFLLGVFALFIPTYINRNIFNLSNCEFESGLLSNYYYFLEILIFVWLVIYLIKKIVKSSKEKRKMVILFSLGVTCFLLSFAGSDLFGNITKHWEIAQYGLFGMPIFMGFLVYLIVEYKIFNIRLLAAQALVVSIVIMVASQFFFIQNSTNQVLTGITLVFVSGFGWWLVKAVNSEYVQAEELRLANIELKKLDRAKSEFINIASHQLRTPVTVIQGVASMMIDGDIDKMPKNERQKFYESVWVKSKKLQTIIHDILNATKLDNKDSVMDKQSDDIDLCQLLSKVVNDFEIETREREIDLVLNKPNSGVSKIRGQRDYLEEVFVNLINNAIKYTPSAKLTNDIRKTRDDNKSAKIIVKIREDKANQNIIVEIRDNGIGISPEAAPNLFKKFSRAENAVKMYTDGTGLGLYIVKEIVEGHGGKVWFESRLNKGTTFFVSLPINFEKISDIRKKILNKENK